MKTSSIIEVHIVSNRILLDEFVDMWNNVKTDEGVTIKVLTTGYQEKKFTLNNGIKVEYIKQKTFPKTTFMNQAWARNELLCYANSEYILFFDDWQKPHHDILAGHLYYLKKGHIVCGRRLDCNKDGSNCREDGRIGDGNPRICDYGQFWTCNSSTKLSNILRVNGFDNRYNGGTGGEDYDMAMRISRLGTKIIYNVNAIAYHYCHDHIASGRKGGTAHEHTRNVSAYKYLPEYGHLGDWNLMTSNDFEFWCEGPIKYFKCIDSGEIGILDSIQVYYHNRDHNIVVAENGLEQVRNCLNNVKTSEKDV